MKNVHCPWLMFLSKLNVGNSKPSGTWYTFSFKHMQYIYIYISITPTSRSVHIEHRTSAICGKKLLSHYKNLVECAFQEQLQQGKPWKNTNYSKYISSAIKHPDVSWGNGIVPVWSPAQMALDHSSLLQYTHPENSTHTFSKPKIKKKVTTCRILGAMCGLLLHGSLPVKFGALPWPASKWPFNGSRWGAPGSPGRSGHRWRPRWRPRWRCSYTTIVA